MNAIGKLVTAAYGARRSLARAVYGCAVAPNATATKLAEDGVVVFPGLMPPDKLAAVARINKDRFEYANAKDVIFSADGKSLIEAAATTPEQFAAYYLLHIKNYSSKLDAYEHLAPLVEPILSSYYRSNWYFREMDCYRSRPVPNEFVGSFAWHRDNYPPGSLKIMLYLTDVLAEDDGPLTYAKGSHRAFEPELGDYGPRVPREDVEGKLPILPCLGPKGTVILFNNNGIHRAANPRRGYREVVNALILPKVTGRRPPVNGTNLETEYTFIRKYTR